MSRMNFIITLSNIELYQLFSFCGEVINVQDFYIVTDVMQPIVTNQAVFQLSCEHPSGQFCSQSQEHVKFPSICYCFLSPPRLYSHIPLNVIDYQSTLSVHCNFTKSLKYNQNTIVSGKAECKIALPQNLYILYNAEKLSTVGHIKS